MSESNLTTATFYEQAEQARRRGRNGHFVRTLRSNLYCAAMGAGGVAILAHRCRRDSSWRRRAPGCLPQRRPTKRHAQKRCQLRSTGCLWFAGAKPNQTFDSFITDSMQRSEREIQDQFPNSPTYNLKGQRANWHIQPTPVFKGAKPHRSRQSRINRTIGSPAVRRQRILLADRSGSCSRSWD